MDSPVAIRARSPTHTCLDFIKTLESNISDLEKFPDDSEEEPLMNAFKQDVRKVFFF